MFNWLFRLEVGKLEVHQANIIIIDNLKLPKSTACIRNYKEMLTGSCSATESFQVLSISDFDKRQDDKLRVTYKITKKLFQH